MLINHNIRNNSLKEANQVKALLKKHKINVVIITNKEKIKTNIQGQARKIRYDLLSKYCLKKNVKVILTAHNLEDQVETFFIRLSRGSGLSGLSAMKPLSILNGKIKIFRPLLEVKKDELIKISKQVYGKFFIDPSNNDTKYLRVKIRNLKKHLFKSGIKYEQIIKSINNLASSKATLEEYFKIIFKKTIQRSRGEILIDLKKFNDYNDEIKIGIINESIKKLKKLLQP